MTIDYARKKKFERIIYISFAILVVFFIVLGFLIKKENKKFREEGIRAEARVLGKYINGTRKSKSYILNLAMFTKGKPIPAPPKSDTTGKKDIEKKIDAIFDKIASERTTIGDYQTVTVTVPSTTYYKLNIDDYVTVVYLKEDPSQVRLLSQVE